MSVQSNQQTILNLLQNLKGIEPLKQLFWSELSYNHANETLSTSSWTPIEKDTLSEEPVLFATAGQNGDFHVIYCRLHSSNSLHITDERLIINRLIRDHLYSLFIFSDATQTNWHFVNVRNDPDRTQRRMFRRISIGPYERLKTASERISIYLDLAQVDENRLSALDIQSRHDEAFDVEAVTRQFFDGYRGIFSLVQKDLESQISDRIWAHDYALCFLNRLMFLYFVQRKGWIGGNIDFIRNYWNAYQESGQPKDTFFDKWLGPLFFEAFNNNKGLLNTSQRDYIPANLRTALSTAPYLNGGLYSKDKLDFPGCPFLISDSRLREVFEFFDRYNFTIVEDSPLDQEVAVDPEMLGRVYEGLVHVETESQEQGEAGIFYTDRIEIDLMCRLALTDWLGNNLGAAVKPLIYQAVFAFTKEEKEEADRLLMENNLWKKVNDLLQKVTVVDPACGSGSFLVGMLLVLDDLLARADNQLGGNKTVYDRRKQIIGSSLYGVDCKEFAVRMAELRLWLQLAIETEIEDWQKNRNEPLLPNLTFKVRCGDSLVQQIGGVDLRLRNKSTDIPPVIKGQLTKLRGEKLKFYRDPASSSFNSENAVKQEELRLFRSILESRRNQAQKEIADANYKLNLTQGDMFSGKQEYAITGPERKELERRRDDLIAELEETKAALNALRPDSIPFVWEMAFAEIFEDDQAGFDIVIGNPPYVRQEKITDPFGKLNSTDYKEALRRSAYLAYPGFFGYRKTKGTAPRKMDGKADLYIFFYFDGLSLLNRKGSFCFITSNSWLDVGYGKDLQEFLIKHSHVKFVLDNQVKRSFKNADINTVICLFSAPDEKETGLENTARFVMFKVPFEKVLSPVIFQELEETVERKSTPEYRVQVLKQSELLQQGMDIPCDADEDTVQKPKKTLHGSEKYTGDKWGGKYLRAPDIYWTILEKAGDKLVRLGDIAEVRFGIKTGCNDFFYLTRQEAENFDIEQEFLKPVIVSPRACKQPLVRASLLHSLVFYCHKDKNELAGTRALEYIKWGEEHGFHRRSSCRSRALWYDIGNRHPAKVLYPMIHNDRPAVFWNEDDVIVDHNLFEIITEASICVWAGLASTLQIIFRELFGRVNLGEGALKTEGMDIRKFYILRPSIINDSHMHTLMDCFNEISNRVIYPIYKEIVQSDRRRLDDLVFGLLDFDKKEIKVIYDIVVDLVSNRLERAKSL